MLPMKITRSIRRSAGVAVRVGRGSFGPWSPSNGVCQRKRGLFASSGREREADCGAVAERVGVASDVDSASVGHNDVMHEHQAEAGALTLNGISPEKIIQSLGCDPWAVVLNFNGYLGGSRIVVCFHVDGSPGIRRDPDRTYRSALPTRLVTAHAT